MCRIADIVWQTYVDLPVLRLWGAHNASLHRLLALVTFLARSAPTMADFIVIAVTWRETYRASRAAADTINGPSFNQVMLHNGSYLESCSEFPR